MTDLTPTLDQLLTVKSSKSIGHTAFSFDRVDDFLKEAYQIHTRTVELLVYLRSIRRPYLSTAPPPRQARLSKPRDELVASHYTRRASQDGRLHLTNTQRDAIDAEAKTTHRDISAAITRLAQAEKVRVDTENALLSQKRRRRGFGALGAWAAGDDKNVSGSIDRQSAAEVLEDGQAATLRACREAVLWFLGRGLEACGRTQSEMMEVRIRREIEKNKGVLSLAGSRGPSTAPGGPTPASVSPNAYQQQDYPPVSQEQLQLFAEENNDLLKHHEDRLTQVRQAEKSLLEISSLQSTLAANLDHQSAAIDQLVNDSFTTAQDVAQGNKELKRAAERKGWAQWAFWATCTGCTVSVVWDLLI